MVKVTAVTNKEALYLLLAHWFYRHHVCCLTICCLVENQGASVHTS